MDLRGISPAPRLVPVYRAIRAGVPVMVEDRVVGEDIGTVRSSLVAFADSGP